jgi:hypothetical protein
MANGGTEPEHKGSMRWHLSATGVWEAESARLAAAEAKLRPVKREAVAGQSYIVSNTPAHSFTGFGGIRPCRQR